MSFSFLKPHLIDIFKTIFDVSAIRVSLEFSRVTENENASLEFMVHVKSSNYDETQRIENITKDIKFTTLIQNETRVIFEEQGFGNGFENDDVEEINKRNTRSMTDVKREEMRQRRNFNL